MAQILAAMLFAVVATAQAPSFHVTFDAPLPAEMRWAQDVRWASAGEIFVTAGRAGVHRLQLRKPLQVMETVVGGETVRGGFFFSSRLAASDGTVLTASPFAGFAWKSTSGRQSTSVDGKHPFATIVDVDVHGKDVVVLGADRDARGQWAQEGAIVWRGSIASGGAELYPLHYSTAGTRAGSLNNCGPFEMGAVRFLPDGSFVVVPGFEPGVFLYDPSGRLKRTWATDRLGFEDRCKLTREAGDEYAKNADLRDAWLNRHTVVEEIVPLASGPGLILRSFDGQKVVWSLLLLEMSGRYRKIPIPVTSSSRLAHLRADVRGDSVVFLVVQYGPLRKPPLEQPRVVVAKTRGLL